MARSPAYFLLSLARSVAGLRQVSGLIRQRVQIVDQVGALRTLVEAGEAHGGAGQRSPSGLVMKWSRSS